MNKFRIYYIEAIANIIFILFFFISAWLFFFKMVENANNLRVDLNNPFQIITVITFCALAGMSFCVFFLFIFHFIRLLNLKEKRLLLKRSIITVIWICLFFLNIALAFYIRTSKTTFFPIINGLAITTYTFSISILIISVFYIKLTRNEILYFRNKNKFAKTIIDELHEN